ncbi:MAG: hypothetical protein PHN49_11875 [Candidatus Omnitrophica bacterium]|nr:hypothetical protein [Candidatus Omnitrophota bacterium]MDD5672325.1 hypothetical protein [Candidatus Omnitrophota bacterium]
MKNFLRLGLIIAGLILGTGCFHLRHAEIYTMSYDQTFMLATAALDDMTPWRLTEADYLNGKITISDMGYIRPTRSVTVIVKRIEPFRTKVQLYGTGANWFNQKYFKAIDRRVQERAVTYPS